nr:uncharacterized protein LOC117276568 [Nicotiana tomentosiformis]XP_033511780.1 uncharacterized protein LOC117276568 [Nicotiana tomentosiformis]
MEKDEAKISGFYTRLVESMWICFTPQPNDANYTLVLKFYANALRTDFQGALVTTVLGVQVNFNIEINSEIYGLPNADNKVYRDRAKAGGNQWLVDKLHDGVTLMWLALYKGVDSHDFTTEPKTWLYIIYARILTFTNDTYVTPVRALMIAAIMDGLPVNVVEHIVREFEEAIHGRSKSLFFPSLITRLCYDVGVLKCPNDNEKGLGKPMIHPLPKKRPSDKQKKRRTDVAYSSFGQFSETTTGPAGPFAPGTGSFDLMGPLQSGPHTMHHLFNQIHEVDAHIRQLIASLPTGPSGAPTSRAPGTGSIDLMGPLQYGPHTMRHLSSQIHGVDAHIRQLIAGLPTAHLGLPHLLALLSHHPWMT